MQELQLKSLLWADGQWSSLTIANIGNKQIYLHIVCNTYRLTSHKIAGK